MRILHCIATMLGGGAERQVGYLAAELVRRGHSVHVALQRGGPNLPRLQSSGATLHWLPEVPTAVDPRALRALARVARHSRCEVVQTWLPRMDVMGGLVALALDRAWVRSERTHCVYTSGSASHRAFRALVGRADAMVANSAHALDSWKGWINPGVPTHVVGNALPLDEIEKAPAVARTSLGVPEGSPLVLYGGRFSPEKGTEAFGGAMVKLLTTRPDVWLVASGEGPTLPAFRRVVDAAGVGHRVVTPGYRSDLWGLMKSATVFVNPSRFEGRPNAVMEAIACRAPVLVSDITSHREILADDAALWFAPDDVPGLTAALVTALDDPEAARARTLRAAQPLPRWGPAAVAEAYEAIYRGVLRP